MNKANLIDAIAQDADISKAAAGRALDALVKHASAALVSGGEVRLSDFGIFSVSTRAARTGRNPQTGEVINLPAARSAKFKAAKALKDALNK